MWDEQAPGELLAEARDGLLAQGDREAAAEAEARLGLLASWQGQGERAIEHSRRAVALLQDAGPSPAKAYALARLAQDHSLLVEPAEAIQVGRQALALAERLGLPKARLWALEAIGLARVLAVSSAASPTSNRPSTLGSSTTSRPARSPTTTWQAS